MSYRIAFTVTGPNMPTIDDRARARIADYTGWPRTSPDVAHAYETADVTAYPQDILTQTGGTVSTLWEANVEVTLP